MQTQLRDWLDGKSDPRCGAADGSVAVALRIGKRTPARLRTLDRLGVLHDTELRGHPWEFTVRADRQKLRALLALPWC